MIFKFIHTYIHTYIHIIFGIENDLLRKKCYTSHTKKSVLRLLHNYTILAFLMKTYMNANIENTYFLLYEV